jgi:thioredoxin 1
MCLGNDGQYARLAHDLQGDAASRGASMTVLTAAPPDREQIAQAFADPSQTVVVSLCAAWCDTCSEFRVRYEQLAQVRPRITFVWLDIEDDAEFVGDIDVENFPTLAIYRGADLLHFGVSLPQAGTVRRLIDAIAASATPSPGAPQPAAQLPDAFLKRTPTGPSQ